MPSMPRISVTRRKDNPEAVMSIGDHLRELRNRLVISALGILIGAVILLMIIMFLFGDEIGEYLFKLLLRLLTLPFVLLFRAGRGIWRALNKRSSRQATTYGQSPQTGYGRPGATGYGTQPPYGQTG